MLTPPHLALCMHAHRSQTHSMCHFNHFFSFQLSLYVHWCFVCMYVRVRLLDPLDQELQTFVSCSAGARTGTRVLGKNTQVLLAPEPSLQTHFNHFLRVALNVLPIGPWSLLSPSHWFTLKLALTKPQSLRSSLHPLYPLSCVLSTNLTLETLRQGLMCSRLPNTVWVRMALTSGSSCNLTGTGMTGLQDHAGFYIDEISPAFPASFIFHIFL